MSYTPQASRCVFFLLVIICSPVFANQQLPPTEIESACKDMLKTPGPPVDTCLCSFSSQGHDESRDGLSERYYLSKDYQYYCTVMPWAPELEDQGYLDWLGNTFGGTYSVAVSLGTDLKKDDQSQTTVQKASAAAKSTASNDAQNRQSQLRSMQSLLTECGFNPGPVDGLWGTKTRIAANDFLKSHGVSAKSDDSSLISQVESFNNRCPDRQVTKLSDNSSKKSEDKDREWDIGAIKVVQWGLERCGYKVEINGIHDAKMKAAMRQYLADSGKPSEDLSLSEFNLEQRGCPKGTSASANTTSLAGQNLAGANLANLNLSTANLTNANLSKANLTNANLSGANLTSTNLANSNLTNTNLTQANLTGATLSGIVAEGTKLKDATLDRANLKNSDMRKAIMIGASLAGAVTAGMRFSAKTGVSVSALASAAVAVPATLAGGAAKWIQDRAIGDLKTKFDEVIAIGKDSDNGYIVIGE